MQCSHSAWPTPCAMRAVGLAVQDHRIDRAADVVDRGIAHDLDRAGVGLDLDLADRAAVGIAAVGEMLIALGRERPAQVVVEIVERLRRARDLEHVERALRRVAAEAAVLELDLVGLGLQHVRGDALACAR